MLPGLYKEAKGMKRVNEIRDDIKPHWMNKRIKGFKSKNGIYLNAIICFLTISQTAWGDRKKNRILITKFRKNL